MAMTLERLDELLEIRKNERQARDECLGRSHGCFRDHDTAVAKANALYEAARVEWATQGYLEVKQAPIPLAIATARFVDAVRNALIEFETHGQVSELEAARRKLDELTGGALTSLLASVNDDVIEVPGMVWSDGRRTTTIPTRVIDNLKSNLCSLGYLP